MEQSHHFIERDNYPRMFIQSWMEDHENATIDDIVEEYDSMIKLVDNMELNPVQHATLQMRVKLIFLSLAYAIGWSEAHEE